MSKYKLFSRHLLEWYHEHARDLPWRQTRDPYKIWISEVMLQQTTVKAVIPYYQKWLKVFPTMSSLQKAPLQKVLKIWQGLGYYQRAKNLHKASEIFCRQYKGEIPSSYEALRKIPGFGPYTAGAVLSIAYNQRVPIIDANVRRVFMRILAVEGQATPVVDEAILKTLEKLLPKNKMSHFNQALMELGALVCKKNEPLCVQCPVRAYCQAYKQGIQEVIPQPEKKVIKELEVAIGVIKNKNKYYIQQRPSQGLFGDLWEFPGGKVEKGESPLEALHRELKEEIECEIKGYQFFMRSNHFYTQFKVHLHVWLCSLKTLPQVNPRRKWVTLQEFKQYPMPSGSARIVDQLNKHL